MLLAAQLGFIAPKAPALLDDFLKDAKAAASMQIPGTQRDSAAETR
jgi:hypothetical protein